MDAVAPFGVAPGVVLRELVSLAVAHSKSTVPAALLADPTGLRTVMQHVVLTDLEQHRDSVAMPTPDDMPGELGVNGRWYSDPARDAYAWLDSPHAAHRALVDDAIDAVRLVRAADALRQRGTTLRTAAGYEIFIDADSGAAVFALRTAGNDRLLLLRADSPMSAGEANLRCAFVTPHGNLRIAFHRGRFSSPAAASAACEATARVVADIGADVLGAFAFRPPSSDLPAPRRDPASHGGPARTPRGRAFVRRRGRRGARPPRPVARGAGRGRRRSRGCGAGRARSLSPRDRRAGRQ